MTKNENRELKIMIQIYNGKMKTADIGESIGIGKSLVGRFVIQLEKSGHVERTKSRRNVYVQLTPLGLKRIGESTKEYKPLKQEKPLRVSQNEIAIDRRMSVIGYLTFDFNASMIARILNTNRHTIYKDIEMLKELKYIEDKEITKLGMKTFDNYVYKNY